MHAALWSRLALCVEFPPAAGVCAHLDAADHRAAPCGSVAFLQVSCLSIPLYSVLPALTEYAAEQGWTMAYPRVDNVGLPMYAVYFVLYMASVEFGVYWMHRGLHEVKLGYK